jgi:hypothetical protein
MTKKKNPVDNSNQANISMYDESDQIQKYFILVLIGNDWQ